MKDYILIITLHADPAMSSGYGEWGGTEAYVREILDLLDEKEIPTLLVTRQSMSQLPLYEKYGKNCEIYRIVNDNRPQTDKHTLFQYHQENFNKIKAIINSHTGNPFCIHSFYWNSGRIAMELSSEMEISFVHSVISNSVGRNQKGAQHDIPERAKYEKQIFDAAKYIFCVSEDEKAELIKFYNTEATKILVAGQAIHSSFLFPAHNRNGAPAIGLTSKSTLPDLSISQTSDFWIYGAFTYLGRMSFDKGVDIIVYAWLMLYEKYGEDCPPLWLIGGQLSDIEQIRSSVLRNSHLLETAEQKRKLMWWGYLNPYGISTLLLKTMVVLMHSRYEPGGRIVLEAMSEGIPVIGTNYGFARDILMDWRNGFKISYGDLNALVDRMTFFVRQPYLGSTLGENAKADALNYCKQLNFEGSHLFAYGLSSDQSVAKSREIACSNRLLTKLNIYPYLFTAISDENICSLINRYTGENVKRDSEWKVDSSQIIRRFFTDSRAYFAKQFTTLMSTNVLYNPVFSNEKVRHGRERFHRENFMYQKLKLPYLVFTDDVNLLLVTEEIPMVHLPNDEYLSLCLNHLKNDYDILSPHEKKIVADICNHQPNSVEEIERDIRTLRENMPDLYFESTGFFSPNHCSKVIQEIYHQNKNNLPKSYIDFLCSRSFKISKDEVRCVNIDAAPRHLIFNGHQICPIDFERMSAGPSEVSAAAFIYFYVVENQSIDPSSLLRRIEERQMLLFMIFCYGVYNMLRSDILHIPQMNNSRKLLEDIMKLMP